MKLELINVNKSFGSNHVLKDISFTATSGKAFGLLGRNGSGKTTSIRIIMDIFEADSGEVLFDSLHKNKTKYRVGYLPEDRGLYPRRTIMEQMVYFGNLRGLKTSVAKERTIFLLKKIGAEEYLNKKLETLSKGNQQKIQLAIALIDDPDVIILDEPFSGLDPVNSMLLKDLVREEVNKKKLVLFSSHQMSNVEEFCDDICIINKGKIVLKGNLEEIKNEYPRDKVFIVPTERNKSDFEKFSSENPDFKNLVSEIQAHKNGFICKLLSEQSKANLLKLLSDKIDMDNFQIVKPSLEEIFVEKAGDHIE